MRDEYLRYAFYLATAADQVSISAWHEYFLAQDGEFGRARQVGEVSWLALQRSGQEFISSGSFDKVDTFLRLYNKARAIGKEPALAVILTVLKLKQSSISMDLISEIKILNLGGVKSFLSLLGKNIDLEYDLESRQRAIIEMLRLIIQSTQQFNDKAVIQLFLGLSAEEQKSQLNRLNSEVEDILNMRIFA